MEKKNENDSNGDEDREDKSFWQCHSKISKEFISKHSMSCSSGFYLALTTILKHDKKKGNNVLLKLDAGVAQW